MNNYPEHTPPEPPTGMKWEYRGLGWYPKKEVTFYHMQSTFNDIFFIMSCLPAGNLHSHYFEAVPIIPVSQVVMHAIEERVVIAEAAGWTDIKYNTSFNDWIGKHPNCPGREYEKIPDYLNDLNVIAEARNTILPVGLRNVYWDNLYAAVTLNAPENSMPADEWAKSWRNFTAMNASAGLHAKVLIKTLNL